MITCIICLFAFHSCIQQQQHIQSQHNPFQSHLQQQSHSDEISAYIGGKPTAMSDVTAKSLSGLESLVDQIPSLNDHDSSHGHQQQPSSVHRSSENRLDIPSMIGNSSGAGNGNGSSGGGGGGSSTNSIDHLHHQTSPFQSSCLYSTNYLTQSAVAAAAAASSSSSLGSPMLSANSSDQLRCSNNRSRASDSANGAATPTNLMSHYSSPSYPSSSLNSLPPVSALHSPNSPQTQTPPMNLNNHPFSVSNLTSNHNYTLTPPPSTPSASSMPMNSINSMNHSYHSNFMAAAMQQPLYIHEFYEKSHPPIPSDFFHQSHGRMSHAAAAYGQHAGFTSTGYAHFPTTNEFLNGAYGHAEKTTNLPHMQPQTQAFAAASTPTIHMPSPNYPYGYGDHHRRQNYIASEMAFFSNHHGMFHDMPR